MTRLAALARRALPAALLLALAPFAAAQERQTATAVFAGGCFWCMEKPFDDLPGVLSTTAGYAGGAVERPSYRQVAGGGTGHREVVAVRYDPLVVSFERLLEVFWRNVDPLDGGGQFCDRGAQYASGIFVADARERALAEASRLRVAARLGRPVATEVLDAARFWPAEAKHQDYYRENPVTYRYYRWRCGRDERLREIWGEEAGGSKPAG
jgi:peptide-methionine (S)-S-oxide reductase